MEDKDDLVIQPLENTEYQRALNKQKSDRLKLKIKQLFISLDQENMGSMKFAAFC